MALERNGSDTLQRSYRYGTNRISQTAGSTVYYYHHDGLGSVADVATSAGASLTWSEYYPYGAIRQAGAGSKPPAVDPFKFAGEQVDQVTGLSYLRARMYDTGTGRFLSLDPNTPDATDPATSAYIYGLNNPVNVIDPSGRDVHGACAQVEGTLGFWFVEFQVCFVSSDRGQVGVAVTGGTGAGLGLHAGGNITGLYSGAQDIYDLNGPFFEAGASGGIGLGGTASGFIGEGHCRGTIVTGVNAGGGVALGAAGPAGGPMTGVWGVGAPASPCPNPNGK
jgi:RHS repeat-associated protein